MARRTRHIERHARSNRRAFTLAEAMIAAVVLAISVVGVAGTMASSSAQSQSTVEASVTTMLGRQLLEEIAAKPFPTAGVTINPGWPTVTNRASYDDAGDYNGYTDSTPLTSLNGDTINPGGTYTRTVTFTQRINPSDTPGAGAFGLIVVKVTGPSGVQAQFSRIIAGTTLTR